MLPMPCRKERSNTPTVWKAASGLSRVRNLSAWGGQMDGAQAEKEVWLGEELGDSDADDEGVEFYGSGDEASGEEGSDCYESGGEAHEGEGSDYYESGDASAAEDGSDSDEGVADMSAEEGSDLDDEVAQLSGEEAYPLESEHIDASAVDRPGDGLDSYEPGVRRSGEDLAEVSDPQAGPRGEQGLDGRGGSADAAKDGAGEEEGSAASSMEQGLADKADEGGQ